MLEYNVYDINNKNKTIEFHRFYDIEKEKEAINKEKNFFKINEYLKLKLEGSETNIYVNNIKFIQCKYLLLNIPAEKVEEFDDVASIDEAAEKLDQSMESISHNKLNITPEAEFWGHCSNIQAWSESGYDTRLLHRNLAFPLLKKLTDAGDRYAKRVFKSEIAERFASGHLTVQRYLMENYYLNYLNEEELECLLEINEDKCTSDSYLLIGNYLLRSKRYQEALKFIIKGLKNEPTSLISISPIKNFFFYQITFVKDKLKIDIELIVKIKKRINYIYENVSVRNKYKTILLKAINNCDNFNLLHDFLIAFNENIAKLSVEKCNRALKSYNKTLINLYIDSKQRLEIKAQESLIRKIKEIQVKRRRYCTEIAELLNHTTGFLELQKFLKILEETILSFNPRIIELLMKSFIENLNQMRIK